MKDKRNNRSPIVLVGLGGFGLLTAIMVKRLATEVFGSLAEAMIKILVIDTAVPRSYVESDEYGVTAEDLELIGPEVYQIGIDSGPSFSIEDHPLLARWVPHDVRPILSDSQALSAGAKAIRSLSATAFYWRYRELTERLTRLCADLMTREVIDQFDTVERLTRIMVVGSAAGGTGSGTIIPTGYLLKWLQESARIGHAISTSAIIGMPELFGSANPKLGANTYQFLKELNHYSRTDTTFVAPIEGARPTTARPYQHVILVSRTNGSIELRDKEEAAELVANHIVLDATA